MSPDNGLMTITDAYTGLRWGELARLQWSRTYLDAGSPHIDVDPNIGALHKVRRRLELGPPKTPVGVRTVHLPTFLADEHGRTAPATRMPGLCSPGSTMGCIGGPTSGTTRRAGRPSTRSTISMICVIRMRDVADRGSCARIMPLVRLGYKREAVETLTALQRRWEEDGAGVGRVTPPRRLPRRRRRDATADARDADDGGARIGGSDEDHSIDG
jgi:hypothetical protein